VTTGEDATFGVGERDEMLSKILRFSQDALAVEPLVFGKRHERVADRGRRLLERGIDLVGPLGRYSNNFRVEASWPVDRALTCDGATCWSFRVGFRVRPAATREAT
jgi:hypothetical protein